jgi:hypothetical protein
LDVQVEVDRLAGVRVVTVRGSMVRGSLASHAALAETAPAPTLSLLPGGSRRRAEPRETAPAQRFVAGRRATATADG